MTVNASAHGRDRGRLLRWILEPVSGERRDLNRERWETLPAALRLPQQASGRSYTACGATHGIMERCNFGCTSCYLTELANTTPPLPFERVKQQLEELRRALGPAAKAQITSGEVTLLSKQELGRIVAYARTIGLDPMVMSNGERFLEDPDYLASLVRDYGLEKVSIHIDTTQRGRRGMRRGAGEREIQPIRDRFARLIREVREQSGAKLHAAQTVTVTCENLESIPAVVRWALDNVEAFRMISFQPAAEVGRTRDRRLPGPSMEQVWRRICLGIGRPLNPRAMLFGHPDCNIVCPLVVVTLGSRHEVVESARDAKRWDRRMMRRILEKLGGFSVVGENRLGNVVRAASLLARHPVFAVEALLYALYRLSGLRSLLLQTLRWLLSGRPVRIRPLAIVVHRFMSPDELDTPNGRERLAACVFKLPVEGRMVAMCEMNATGLRRSLNELQRRAGS